MDFSAELAQRMAQFKPDPALEKWLSETVQTLADQAQKDAAQLKLANLKIAALTLELAHHKRMKFGAKTESFSLEQRDLFVETGETDLSAIQTEVGQAMPPAPRVPRKTAGRQALPENLPRIEHRHEPDSCACGQCRQRAGQDR
jgi:transposase